MTPNTTSTVLAVLSVVYSAPLVDVTQAVSSTDVGRCRT